MILVSGLGSVDAPASVSDYDAAASRVQALDQRIADAEMVMRQVSGARARVRDLRKVSSATKIEWNRTNTEARASIAQAQAELGPARAELERLQAEVDALEDDAGAIAAAVSLAEAIQSSLETESNTILARLPTLSIEVQNAADVYQKALDRNEENAETLRVRAVKVYNMFADDLKTLQKICNQMQVNADGAAYTDDAMPVTGGMVMTSPGGPGVNGLGFSLKKLVSKIGSGVKRAVSPVTRVVEYVVKDAIKNPLNLINPVAHVKGMYEAQKIFVKELRDQRRAIHGEIRRSIKKVIGEKAYNTASNIAKRATPYVIIAAGVVLTIVTGGAATPLAIAATVATGAAAVTGQALREVAAENQAQALQNYGQQVMNIITGQQDVIQQQQDVITGQGPQSSVYDQSALRVTSWYDKFSCWVGYCPQ